MGVDYKAGIAYGVKILHDDLYELLEQYFSTIDSVDKLPSWWNITKEEFIEWKKEYSFSDLKEILYDKDILINTNAYADCGDYIIGFILTSVECGATAFSIDSIELYDRKEEVELTRKWINLLGIKEEPDFLLFSQLT